MYIQRRDEYVDLAHENRLLNKKIDKQQRTIESLTKQLKMYERALRKVDPYNNVHFVKM